MLYPLRYYILKTECKYSKIYVGGIFENKPTTRVLFDEYPLTDILRHFSFLQGPGGSLLQGAYIKGGCYIGGINKKEPYACYTYSPSSIMIGNQFMIGNQLVNNLVLFSHWYQHVFSYLNRSVFNCCHTLTLFFNY